jgi:hypothetical protein
MPATDGSKIKHYVYKICEIASPLPKNKSYKRNLKDENINFTKITK